MRVRCVVTGQDAGGKSVVARDGAVEAVTLSVLPGHDYWRLWGRDEVARLPEDGGSPVPPSYFPPPGGFRFGLFTVPPATATPAGELDIAAAVAEFQRKLPGMAEVLERDEPGMHTTDTVDFAVILSGEVGLELDDGVEVVLKAGDCLVQNGTRHRWNNRTSEPCLIAVCLLGARRE